MSLSTPIALPQAFLPRSEEDFLYLKHPEALIQAQEPPDCSLLLRV